MTAIPARKASSITRTSIIGVFPPPKHPRLSRTRKACSSTLVQIVHGSPMTGRLNRKTCMNRNWPCLIRPNRRPECALRQAYAKQQYILQTLFPGKLASASWTSPISRLPAFHSCRLLATPCRPSAQRWVMIPKQPGATWSQSGFNEKVAPALANHRSSPAPRPLARVNIASRCPLISAENITGRAFTPDLCP